MLKLLFIVIILFHISNANQTCGISYYSNITKQEHFPWIAVLYSSVNKKSDGSDMFLCGSSIISKKFALTAAHCVQEKGSFYRRKFDEIYLLSNVHDLWNIEEANKILIVQIFVHFDYSAEVETYDADLSLLAFAAPLVFDEKVVSLCLLYENVSNESTGKIISYTDPEPGDPGYDNYEHDPYHNFPRIFSMPIRSECVKKQPRFREIASERTFCAGGLNYGPCLEVGSSGSSMVIKIDEKYFIRGIVSASFIDFTGCDNYTYSLFTDVPKFMNWIEEIILE